MSKAKFATISTVSTRLMAGFRQAPCPGAPKSGLWNQLMSWKTKKRGIYGGALSAIISANWRYGHSIALRTGIVEKDRTRCMFGRARDRARVQRQNMSGAET